MYDVSKPESSLYPKNETELSSLASLFKLCFKFSSGEIKVFLESHLRTLSKAYQIHLRLMSVHVFCQD